MGLGVKQRRLGCDSALMAGRWSRLFIRPCLIIGCLLTERGKRLDSRGRLELVVRRRIHLVVNRRALLISARTG